MIFAEAIFNGNKRGNIKGVVAFTQINPISVRVDIHLKGVPDGVHGIHVHEKPVQCFKAKDLKSCCSMAGGHFNGSVTKWSKSKPTGTPHGSFMLNTDRHVGDLCNNVVSHNGIVNFSYIDNLISLIPNHPHNIIGRSIVLHEDEDDQGLLEDQYDQMLDNYAAAGIPFEITDDMRNSVDESLVTGNAGARIACANIELIQIS